MDFCIINVLKQDNSTVYIMYNRNYGFHGIICVESFSIYPSLSFF
jgi:hypothetical protein